MRKCWGNGHYDALPLSSRPWWCSDDDNDDKATSTQKTTRIVGRWRFTLLAWRRMFHSLKGLFSFNKILVKRYAPNLSVSVYEPKFELTPYHVTNRWEEGWLWLRYLYLSRPDDWLNAVYGLVAMQEYILCERCYVGASVRCQSIRRRRLVSFCFYDRGARTGMVLLI